MKTLDIRTSISLTPQTRERLVDIGRKNESYDTLLNRLMDHYHNFTISGTTKRGKK